ncbi:PAS domain-containing protein [Pseudomonas sp. PS02290]|uniref:PAS domain-containing protein n=1 Tax=Pseudomonas sp. PS02290 TaxID=2991430 RepID=UPI003FA6B285
MVLLKQELDCPVQNNCTACHRNVAVPVKALAGHCMGVWSLQPTPSELVAEIAMHAAIEGNTQGFIRPVDSIFMSMRVTVIFNNRLKNRIQQLEKRLGALEQVKATLDLETVAVTLDAAGVILEVNALFEKELGFTHAELSGRTLREFSPAELHGDVHQRRALEAIAKGKHYSGTLRLCSREGRHVWLRAMVIPFAGESGRVERIVLYCSVLTRTIEASRENEALVGALMRSTAVIEFSLDG